jgi:formylglycine-generating enzyme required for sulfatase activity
MRFVLLCILLASGAMTPAYGQQPKAITNSIGMKLVLIHAGSFAMGSPVREVGRDEKEQQHEVTISDSYYIGVFEVTQGEYEKVIGNNPSAFMDVKNPVETVSWDDSVAFCEKLSEVPEEKAAGRKYRLPTEAE